MSEQSCVLFVIYQFFFWTAALWAVQKVLKCSPKRAGLDWENMKYSEKCGSCTWSLLSWHSHRQRDSQWLMKRRSSSFVYDLSHYVLWPRLSPPPVFFLSRPVWSRDVMERPSFVLGLVSWSSRTVRWTVRQCYSSGGGGGVSMWTCLWPW